MIAPIINTLVDEIERQIRWHENAIKRHNKEISRLNEAFSEALKKSNGQRGEE